MEERRPTGRPRGSSTGSGRGRRPTMKDVAAHLGVSQTLVSMVFRNAPGASDSTRERVFQAAAELGYRPDTAAQVLRRTRSRHLGVLFDLDEVFSVDLVKAIYPIAQRVGYHVVLAPMDVGRDEQAAVEELLSFRSEAVIEISSRSSQEQLERLAEQVPVIQVGRRLKAEAGVDVVRVADEHGAQQAVDHLVELGHERIIHVAGSPGASGAVERRRGYQKAMRRHGLQHQIRVLPGDYTEESGARAAMTLLNEEDLPTAIFAATDRCAHGLIDTLRRGGVRVPEDVSIVGYDDSSLASLSFLDLTTIRVDAPRMAELAVEAALERLDKDREVARDIVLRPQLIARGSSCPPRSGDLSDEIRPAAER